MISKFFKYIGNYKKYTILAPLAIMIEVILEVYVPFLMADIINVGASEGDVSFVLKVGLLTILLSIASLLFGAISGWASSIAGTGFAKNVREALFAKISDFSFANIDKFSTSSLITRLTVDVNNLQMSFMMLIRVFIRAPFMLISATIMSFIINPKVAVIFLISMPLLAIVFLSISSKAFPKFQKMLKKYDTMNRDLQENLIGIRAVKAFVREDNEIAKFDESAKLVRDAQVGAEGIIALNMPIMQTIIGITMASVLFMGGRQIIIGNMEAGDLMTLVTYGMQILISIMMLSMIIVMLVLSKASVTRIIEILDEDIDLRELPDAIKKDIKVKNGDIEFKNVNFKYNKITNSSELKDIYEELNIKLDDEDNDSNSNSNSNSEDSNDNEIDNENNKNVKKNKKKIDEITNFTEHVKRFKKAVEKIVTPSGKTINKQAACENFVLEDINLKISSGETVGIIGGTGSSKSTLISLIPRLYDATSGKVLVGDVDVKNYTLKNLRNAVSVVLQKNVLFSGTIKENLKWGNKNATDEEIEAVCKIADAHDFIMSFPNGYETELGQAGVNVSGGQKQRLTIARALLKDPKVLILDDSMSAVDTKTDANIRKALKKYKPDITKIIIAQRISSISDADKIIVLEDGKINGIGTHAELIKGNEIYKEIYNSQRNGGK